MVDGMRKRVLYFAVKKYDLVLTLYLGACLICRDETIKPIHRRENEVDFHSLRTCQEECLNQIRQTMRYSDVSKFLVVKPTGVGKTAVIALAPFALNVSNKVLILTPTVWLREQIAKNIKARRS